MSPEPRPPLVTATEKPKRPIGRLLRRLRAWMDDHPAVLRIYRIGVAAIGGGVALLGLLLVPLPGPGWLVVFLGLAILGSEFAWAKRMAAFVKRAIDRFWAWLRARRAAKA